MRHRRLALATGLLTAASLVAACGTRMDRADIALAERGGLAAGTDSPPAAAPDGTGGPVGDPSGSASAGDPAGVPPSPADGGAVPSPTGPARSDVGPSSSPRPGLTAGAADRPGAAPPGAGGSAPGRNPGRPSTPTGGSGTPSGTPAATPPRPPVAIGTVGTLSGPVGAMVRESVFGISVWVKWVNSQGGVSGHPVRHIVTDDGGDPARYNAAVRELVEKQGVIAFLFNTIGYVGGDLSYVEEKRVPIIGHESGTELAYSSPMVFTPYPSGTSYAYSLLAGAAAVAVPADRTKLGSMACADVKLCDMFDETWTGPAAKELGFEVAYRSRPSLTQPDFTAECLSARQAGVQVIIAGVDNNTYLRIARSCARQNYKPLIIVADQLALPSLAADPVMEGNVVVTKVAPWTDTDIPGVAEMHRVFAAVASGVEINGAHAGGWVTAKTFELATRALPATATAADVLSGLWSINGDDLGGMTHPLTFAKDQPSRRARCWGTVLIQDGKFVRGPTRFRCG